MNLMRKKIINLMNLILNSLSIMTLKHISQVVHYLQSTLWTTILCLAMTLLEQQL